MPKVQIIENKDNSELVDINNVEIFQAGTFNNKTYTQEDLIDAVNMYNQSKENFTPILKITHDEPKQVEGDQVRKEFKIPFRVGSVENLRLIGNKLIADFKDVLKPVAMAIKNKLLFSHSAEFYPNVEFKGKVYKKFLYGVALLGSDVPALFSVFKPYMYQFSNNEMTENNTNDRICDIIKIENQSMIECFEKDFIYEEGLMAQEQSPAPVVAPIVKATQEQPKENFSLKVQELENKVIELTSKLVNNDKEKFTVLQNQVAILDAKLKSKEIEMFSLDLIKQAKITPAVSDKLNALLLKADNTVKEKFSIGSEVQEKTTYELVKEIFQALPVNQSLALEEQVKANKTPKDEFDLSKFKLGEADTADAFDAWLVKNNHVKNKFEIDNLSATEYSNKMQLFLSEVK